MGMQADDARTDEPVQRDARLGGQRATRTGGWEPHHMSATDRGVLSNCEILCQECHKKTGTFGG